MPCAVSGLGVFWHVVCVRVFKCVSHNVTRIYFIAIADMRNFLMVYCALGCDVVGWKWGWSTGRQGQETSDGTGHISEPGLYFMCICACLLLGAHLHVLDQRKDVRCL